LEIIIFAPASAIIGGSHAIRMAALAKIITNLRYKVTMFQEIESLRNYVTQISEKTLIILDVPEKFNHNLAFLSKINLVRIGYEYSGELEVEYNIVPFAFKSRQFSAKKTLFTGMKYLILRPEIKKRFSRSTEQKFDAVISLGAGDTLDKALEIRRKILSQYQSLNVKIVLGEHSVYKGGHEAYVIKNPTNFYELLRSSSYLITNAGTTLVEAIYLQKKILAWPQSDLELEFALYLNQSYEFEIIDGLEECLNLSDIKRCKFQGVSSTTELDIKGVQRVGKLIYDIIIDEMDTK
jgi:spore coat polysaccharide biosynthesis predicted glycosyltransferase SpsG